MHDGTRRLVTKVLTRSREPGGLADGVDIEVETERRTALLDGPMTTVMDAHLDSIAKI